MRFHAIYWVGALIATALPFSAEAVPTVANHEAAISDRDLNVHTCPSGYYWEKARYARHGKFRYAHCEPGYQFVPRRTHLI